MSDVDIRVLDDPTEMKRMTTMFSEVWGATTPLVGVELLRAIQHAGGYVAAAYAREQVVGGSVGFLGRHDGAPSLHSHLTGILPAVRGTGLGREIKLHQRAWAAKHGLTWVTWTFDPLVRRNAWFNLRVLGAAVREYLVDFYGPIDDAINAGVESDRLLVVWAADDRGDERGDEGSGPPDGAPRVIVATPDDVVALRRTDPAGAAAWRRRVRAELGGQLAAGGRIADFTRDGSYVVVAGPS